MDHAKKKLFFWDSLNKNKKNEWHYRYFENNKINTQKIQMWTEV